MNGTEEKITALTKQIKGLESVAVAFSGGVDSTLLLYICNKILGANTLAVIANSPSFPRRELNDALSFCNNNGIRYTVCDFDQMAVPGFTQNTKDRCYVCKRALFGKIKKIAYQNGISNIAEGSNLDDTNDYRPGMAAIKELGIISPLLQAKMTKQDIRQLSREYGLPTWQKPSLACLSTRIEYGRTITAEKLAVIEKSEQLLAELGALQCRVRMHGAIARIEVDPMQFKLVTDNAEKISSYLKSLGFSHVTLDLAGYKTGSMNTDI